MSVGEGMKMVISGGTVVPPISAGSRAPVTVPHPPLPPGEGESKR